MNWSVAKLLLWCQETFNSFGSKPAAFCCFLSPPNQIKSEGRSGKGSGEEKTSESIKRMGDETHRQHTQTQKSPRSSENLCWTNSEVLAPVELLKLGEEKKGLGAPQGHLQQEPRGKTTRSRKIPIPEIPELLHGKGSLTDNAKAFPTEPPSLLVWKRTTKKKKKLSKSALKNSCFGKIWVKVPTVVPFGFGVVLPALKKKLN